MKEQMIVGIGEILWDMLPDGKKPGGAPANFAYHASQSGHTSCVVSAIGNDILGQEIIKSIESKSLKHQIEAVDYPTGVVLVDIDSNGIPCYQIKENVAWDNIPFSWKLSELAEETSVVCFGSLAQRSAVSRETIHRFIKQMPQGDLSYKIFDINLRQHFYNAEIINQSIELCNVLKINDEELETVSKMFLFSEMDLQNRCLFLLEKYALKILILTCGINGSYVFTPENISFFETPKVKVADTVGAGDSFTGAFISAILNGKTVADAHRLAVDVSAFVCTQKGATPELPVVFKQQLI